jgi:putative phosphonate metabolism protein
MTARYAIYCTPAPDSALWRLASAWLGRDTHADCIVPRPAGLTVAPADLAAATANPSRYGFHATLVAPFELAPGRSEEELAEMLATFCRNWPAFRAALRVDRIYDFLALVPAHADPRLDTLAAACVRGFDRFRAPLSEADIARRSTPDLNEHEQALLKRWGYAHVLDAFRFHMSLTGALPDETITRLQPELTALFKDVLQQPVDIDGLSLLKQSDRAGPFHCIARHDFAPVEIAAELH